MAEKVQLDFQMKRVIVAGGSRGIGRSIALAFANAGARVSICARGTETLEKTRVELAGFGGQAHAAACDLADGAQVSRYIEEAAKALGGIDVLVNNASGFGMTDDEQGWDTSVAVDLFATVRASRTAIPHMERAKGGAIINISSVSSLQPTGRSPAYGAVKAAVNQLTMSQAVSLAGKNIRVNCIAPGSIEFPGGSWERAKTSNPALYKHTVETIPFDRLGKPEEIANVVLFVASPLANWLTGQTIVVDGGQTLFT
jgi:3-oxoacyl-[acyl-carrier protein] reductase